VEFQHLHCFVAVAEELHFGRAAERVHLTPSPVSRTVRELERELGGELFVRRYHRIELTQLGEELLPQARRILEEADRLKVRAQALVLTGPARSVHLGVSTLCPPAAFEAVVDLIEHALPGRRVDVELAPASHLLPLLEDGGLDLAMVQLPLGRPHLSTVRLAQCGVWVVMRTDDRFAGYDHLSLDQLAGRTLTLGSPHVEPVAMATMIANLRAHGVLDLVEMPQFDHVRLAAQIRYSGGLALTLHPDTGGSARIFDDPAFRLVPLTDEGFKFSLGAAWRTAAVDGDDLLREVVEVLRNHWSVPAVMH
jgi:DNA-binding transcriptional LysR family regulator